MDPDGLLLGRFFDHPMERFGIRQLGRETGLDTKTVMRHVEGLVRRKLVERIEEPGRFVRFEAARLSAAYLFEKSDRLLHDIFDSGLIDYLRKALPGKAVVLFGSARKGTYHAKSDIDIFIQAPQKELEIVRFERKLNRKIHLIFDEKLGNLTEGLAENVINGNVVCGRLRLHETEGNVAMHP